MAVHEGFEDHLAVVFQRKGDGVLQLGAVMGLGDAHAGTGVGGLDEDGPAEFGDGTVADAFEVGLDLPAVRGQPLGVGDAGGVEQGVVKDVFVLDFGSTKLPDKFVNQLSLYNARHESHIKELWVFDSEGFHQIVLK